MWTYVYTDRNNDFLAHAGRKGMKWGKHIYGNAAEEMRQAIERAKASAPAQTNATSSGRKRNASGEATGSMERRESVSGGPANPNGAYNRPAQAQTTATTSSGRKRNVSGEATGSLERREAAGSGPVNPNGAYSNRTSEQKEAFNKWNNRSDVVKKQAEIQKQMRKEAVTRKRLNLHSRSKVVRHSAWTYRYTDYNNDYEDFLMHRGHGSTFL